MSHRSNLLHTHNPPLISTLHSSAQHHLIQVPIYTPTHNELSVLIFASTTIWRLEEDEQILKKTAFISQFVLLSRYTFLTALITHNI